MSKYIKIKIISKVLLGTFFAISGIILLPIFLVTFIKDNIFSSSYDFVASADGGYTASDGSVQGCQGVEGGPCCNN